ncbi:hypothetical protein GDO81_027913 [Engystomops pustulosus]|uniref:Uncharacterized protein n=1 Tax=Engystomops pustulosus TaxID=76066 RepID=A0AAV6YLR8_ENGPU|nr:hypothetical protein GDO81_027913 [Engystomops pustulosus]
MTQPPMCGNHKRGRSSAPIQEAGRKELRTTAGGHCAPGSRQGKSRGDGPGMVRLCTTDIYVLDVTPHRHVIYTSTIMDSHPLAVI